MSSQFLKKIKNLLVKNQAVILVIMVIFAGFLLRALFPLQREFSFDQAQIAQAAEKILKGQLTLIGPQTGPAAFHTGPLIYYIAAVVYFFTNLHPIANTVLALVIYLLTAISIFFILKSLLDEKLALVFTAIYCLSPYFVSLDKITWNPNFSFLSATLVLAFYFRQ